MDRSVIDAYKRGAYEPARAILGLAREKLNAVPVPGTWSIQQIVLHLVDSDLIASDRMKRVIAEENPTIVGFDESAFARHLFYGEMDAQLAADVFAKNRLLTAALLRRLPDQAFARYGTHNERGRITLEHLVAAYVEHLEHHLRFIHQKRKLLGKE
jgi:hypothetical protein